jgi:hypothetical protein
MIMMEQTLAVLNYFLKFHVRNVSLHFMYFFLPPLDLCAQGKGLTH